jgi:tetratricopeptide (TPR) repeat protein
MNELIATIQRALDADDISTAAELAAHALAQGSREPLVFNLAAWRLEERGEFDEAEALLGEALALTPDDPSLHLALGVVLRGQGRLKLAVDSFERAISLDGAYSAAWFERGSTFEKGGALADAADDYRRAIALEPENAAAHASLAAVCARRGSVVDATKHAERAMQLDPGSVTARNALAQIAIEQKHYNDAITLLEPVVGVDEDKRDLLVSTRTLLGDAYEGIGRYDDAYASYERAQHLFYTIHSSRLSVDRQDPLSFLKGIEASFAAADKALWHAGDAQADARPGTHVFLTGYPRSGTTLVENILATLPGAIAIEERPTLGEIDRTFLNDPDGLQKLAMLPESELAGLRAAYWQRAEQAAGESLAGKVFIDMDPFKGPRLPVIAKLFPNAKVVIMRRDPRDVVWSCFHTSFAFNAGTLAFSSLENTARHYDLSWHIVEDVLATLSIDHFDLRYDALVQNFDVTTQALCAFLGVAWDEKLREFDRTAQQRGVSTASATQVRRGLYDGSGGWRRYARQLATVEPILRPWIERLGYADA